MKLMNIFKRGSIMALLGVSCLICGMSGNTNVVKGETTEVQSEFDETVEKSTYWTRLANPEEVFGYDNDITTVGIVRSVRPIFEIVYENETVISMYLDVSFVYNGNTVEVLSCGTPTMTYCADNLSTKLGTTVVSSDSNLVTVSFKLKFREWYWSTWEERTYGIRCSALGEISLL